MGRKRRADAIETNSVATKDATLPVSTPLTNNENSSATSQINANSVVAGNQQPVTAAKTSVASVVATPGSALSSDHPKAKVSESLQ